MEKTKLKTLIDIICTAANVNEHHLFSKTRDANVVAARHVIWYIAHEFIGYSYPFLSGYFSRDHTTIIHGVRKFQRTKGADPVIERIRKSHPGLLSKEPMSGARTIENWNI